MNSGDKSCDKRVIGREVFRANATGMDISSEEGAVTALANSIPFLVIGLVLSIIILYAAGIVVRRCAVNDEMKLGVIVYANTVAVYVPLYVGSDGYSDYPPFGIAQFLS